MGSSRSGSKGEDNDMNTSGRIGARPPRARPQCSALATRGLIHVQHPRFSRRFFLQSRFLKFRRTYDKNQGTQESHNRSDTQKGERPREEERERERERERSTHQTPRCDAAQTARHVLHRHRVTPSCSYDADEYLCVQPEPLVTAPGSKRPPAQGAEAVPSLKADRHRFG